MWNCGLLCIMFVERGVEGEVRTYATITDVRKVKLGMLLDFSPGTLDWKTYCSLGMNHDSESSETLGQMATVVRSN